MKSGTLTGNPARGPKSGGPVSRSHEGPQPPVSAQKGRIRVMIADDHPVVRKGLSAFLAQCANIEVAGEARDGEEALRKARELTPDVVLMDIDMPRSNGLIVAETIRKELPQIKILILSGSPTPNYALRIVQTGAHGYVAKEASAEELARAVETVHRGETFFAAEVASRAVAQMVGNNGAGNELGKLSDREREVLSLIAQGLYNKEVGAKLNIGTRTVETHRERIMRKLNIRSTAGLTKFAIANGLITLNEKPAL